MYSKKKKKFNPNVSLMGSFHLQMRRNWRKTGIAVAEECFLVLRQLHTVGFQLMLLASFVSRSSTFLLHPWTCPKFYWFCSFGSRNWEGTRRTMNREVEIGKLLSICNCNQEFLFLFFNGIEFQLMLSTLL